MQSTVISTLPIILDNCQNEASTDLHHKSDMTLSQLQVLDEVRRFSQLSNEQLKIFH